MTSSSKTQPILTPILAVLAGMAAIQIGVAFAKSLFPVLGAFATSALRLTMAAVVLVTILRPWRNWPKNPPIASLLALGLTMGVSGIVGYQALARLPMGVVIAMQFLGPIGVAVASTRRPIDFLWIGLALAGVWALVWRGVSVGDLDPFGLLLCCIGACCWASYMVFGRRVSLVFGRATPALALSLGALILLPVGVAHLDLSQLGPQVLLTLALVALFSTAIPYTLEFYAMPRMPPKTFSVISCLEPAFAAISGWVLLRESLSVQQVAGLALVIAAAGGAIWSARK